MEGIIRAAILAGKAMFGQFLKDESGATAIEYGLIVAVLSLAVIGAFSQAVNVMHNNFNSQTEVINNSMR